MVLAKDTGKKEDEETYTLDELVVIASKHPEKLSEAPVSVEVIDEKDISKKNAQNVADLLRDVSSVNISDHGGPAGQKTISIRGSDSSQVLVLIDGQPINSRQNGQVDLGQLPIDQIKKIEVLKGPASSLYGANALGGVVDITTKSGSEQPITNVETNFGSFKTREMNLTHMGSVGDLRYNISAFKKKTDGHRENSWVDQDKVFIKFNYRLDDYSDLSLSLKYNDSEKGSPGPSNSPSLNAEQNDEDMNVNLQWKRQTENRDQNLNVYYNQHENIYENPDLFEYSNHETEKSGFIFGQTNYYQNNILTYGVDINKNEIDSNENGEHDFLNKSIFIQDEWEFISPLKFNFGGRYDDHEKFGTEFSPRLGAVYTISSNLNFHTSIGEAYRAPTFNELYWPYMDYGSYGIYEGNPDLDPETATAYETGLRYSDEDLKGEINLFKKDVDDLIKFDQGSDGVNRPYNVNSAEITGVELILSKKLTSNYSTDFNYTYLDARNEETDERLDDKPYHTANLGLNYYQNDIEINLDGKLVSGRYKNGNDFPSYFVTDLKLSKELEKNTKVALEMNNLFDRDYQVLDGYPMPGRNVMINLSREF
nr:TonB-dependent receptor [Sporohalobacter salinus]